MNIEPTQNNYAQLLGALSELFAGNQTRQAQPVYNNKRQEITAPQQTQESGFSRFLGGVSDTINTISSVNDFFNSQRGLAKQQGVGLLAQANNLAGEVGQYVDLFRTLTSKDGLKGLGQAGQSFILQNLEQELSGAITSKLGIVAQDMGLDQLGNTALNYLKGSLPESLTSFGETASAEIGSALNSGAAATTTEGLAGTASEGLAGTASTVLGAAGAAYGAYNLIKNFGKSNPVDGAVNGATVGATIGSVIPGVGTLIGAGVGAVVGGLLGFVKNGKHKDQIARDNMRKGLEQIGVINQEHQVTLADGSLYDIGKDGGFKLKNQDGTERPPYNTDTSNPLAGNTIPLLIPLAYALFPDNEKLRTDLVGYLTNAATSNATDMEGALKNVQAMYLKLGQPKEAFGQLLQALGSSGAIDQQKYAVLAHQLDVVFGPTPQNTTQQRQVVQ